MTLQAWLSITMDSSTSHTPSLAFRHHGLWLKATLQAWLSVTMDSGTSHTPSLAFRHHGLWHKVTLQAWLSVTMDSGSKPHSKPGFPSPWTLAQSHTQRLAFRHHGLVLAQSHSPRLAFRHHGLWHKVTLQAWLSVTMDSGTKSHSTPRFPSPSLQTLS